MKDDVVGTLNALEFKRDPTLKTMDGVMLFAVLDTKELTETEK